MTQPVNPAAEKVIRDVPRFSKQEVDVLIEKASPAFRAWAHVSPPDRARGRIVDGAATT